MNNPIIKKEIRLAAEKEEKAFYNYRATDEWLKDLEPFETNSSKPFLEIAPSLIVVFKKSKFHRLITLLSLLFDRGVGVNYDR